MTKGKQWTNEQETELKNLIDANENIELIADKLEKSTGAIYIKCQRLGLKTQLKDLTNSVPMPRDLPSIEETLRMIAGALKTAIKPGLNKVEVQRLQVVATIAKTYKEILADYIDYREIEIKLKEMEELNAKILGEKSTDSSDKPDKVNVP